MLIFQNIAIVILLTLSSETRIFSFFQHFMELEKELLEEQTNVPIYFAYANENLESLVYDVCKKFATFFLFFKCVCH